MNDVGGEGAEAALDRVPVAVKEKIVPETPVTGKAARTSTELVLNHLAALRKLRFAAAVNHEERAGVPFSESGEGAASMGHAIDFQK